jgi:site-specific DNA-methyltransferase (adenine-specific)
MGSGTTSVAALDSSRNFIGFDNNKKYIDLAERRLYSYKNRAAIFG